MTTLSWIHLSDWHQRGEEFDRTVIRDSLMADIRDRANISKDLARIDFIVFSGDVAWSGSEVEYGSAVDQFFQPLLRATQTKPTQIFMVPGNHDVVWERLSDVPAE